MSFRLTKEERLSKKKLIDELFANGSSFYFSPFKVISHPKNSETGLPPARILISVPSKNFKRAVDRNRIKRLIREAYRLNKNILYDALNQKHQQLIFAIIYTSKTIESFSFIREKIVSVLKKLAAQNAMAEKNAD